MVLNQTRFFFQKQVIFENVMIRKYPRLSAKIHFIVFQCHLNVTYPITVLQTYIMIKSFTQIVMMNERCREGFFRNFTFNDTYLTNSMPYNKFFEYSILKS